METTRQNDLAASVSYEEPPIAEAEVDGFDYRLDASHGSALAISRRASGTWEWTPLLEARWDGTRLRAKGLEHAVVTRLARALADAMRLREDGI